MTDLFVECSCVSRYSIEPQDGDYALYYGRCRHRHGYNLVTMVDPAFNFELRHIEKLINLGDKEYEKNPDGGHLAE